MRDVWAGVPDELRNKLQLWAMIETPRGVLRAAQLAEDSDDYGLTCLVAGTTDLTADLNALHTADRSPLLHSLSHIVLAARANKLMALDGVHLHLDDAAGFEATCVQGRQLGFDGRTLIHPSQVAVANRVYSPSAAEVEHARRVITAFTEAVAAGHGVAVVDGKLVENMHVEVAKRALAIHDAVAARAGECVAEAAAMDKPVAA